MSSAYAQVPSIGEFFDLLQQKKIKPTLVNLGDREIDPNFSQPSQEVVATTQPPSSKSLIEVHSLRFSRAVIEDSSLIVEATEAQTGKKYRVRFHSQVKMSAAIHNLLTKVGLRSVQQRFVDNLSIHMSADELQALQELWPRHPERIKWSEFWKSYDITNSQIVVQKALLEPEIELFAEGATWNHKADQEIASLALFSLWLQCGDMLSNKNLLTDGSSLALKGFEACLGYGLRSGTPNMFAPNVFNTSRRRAKPYDIKLQNFNIVSRDPAYREALSKIDSQDVYSFLRRTDSLEQSDIEDLFVGYGFPRIYSELVSAKLIERRNQMLKLLSSWVKQDLKLSPKPLYRQIEHISDGEHIIDGVIVKDFPGVRLDQTNTLIQNLMENVAKPVLQGLENQAKQMLAHFPYTGVELIKFGNSFIGAGILFRIKRMVEQNPNPSGHKDRYIVQDTVRLGITGNIGRNFKYTTKLNLWLSVGAGFASTYSYKKKVASLEEAQSQYWLIPYHLIFERDFRTLKRGETFAVQRGFMGIGGGGGNLKFHRKIRPAGYILFGLNYLNNFQVTRTDTDDLFIIQGEDDSWSFQTKAYLRALSRYFRIPFAGYNYRWGDGYSKLFEINREDYKTLKGKERLEFETILQNTLTDRDVEDLSKVVGFSRTDFDYTMSSSFISFLDWRSSGTHSRGRFEVDFSPEHSEKYELDDSHYFVSKLNENVTSGKTDASEVSGCRAGSVLEYESADQKIIKDGLINFDCHIFTQIETEEDLSNLRTHLSRRTLANPEAINKFFAEVKTLPFDAHVSYKGDVYWPSLERLVRFDKNSNEEIIEKIIEAAAADISSERRRNAFANLARQQFWQFIGMRTPQRRIESLQNFFFDENNYNSVTGFGQTLFKYFLSVMDDKKISLTIDVKFRTNTENYTFEVQQGSHLDSSAKDYYEWRELQGIKGIIDDY